MKNNYLVILMSIFLLLLSILSNSQVGIGTASPRGVLDINYPTTSTFGLVLPNNSSPTNIINPQGATIAEGTTMYDSTDKCIKFYNGSTWSSCLGTSASSGGTVSVNCSQGFSGTYTAGVALSQATYRVTITNNTLSPTSFALQTSNLVLSGVGGITVSSVSPTSANIAPGASQVITYNL